MFSRGCCVPRIVPTSCCNDSISASSFFCPSSEKSAWQRKGPSLRSSGHFSAAIGPIAIRFPERVETKAQLQAEYPAWDMPLIFEKTGIASRHIAAPGECASDLAVAAANKLFQAGVDPQSIDFVLLCTQTPD